MTKKEFEVLPQLLMEHHLAAVGYGRATVAKFVDCGVLERICPKGCGQARYQKRQVAQILKWEECLVAARGAFVLEPALMPPKAVRVWTGWSETTLGKIAHAGGLSVVRPPGTRRGKFRKDEVAKLIGF